MNCYVFDPDEEKVRRDWSQLLGEEPEMLLVDDDGQLVFRQAPPSVPAFLFVHCTRVLPSEVQAWSMHHKEMIFVCISAGSRPEKATDTRLIFWRRAIVSKPTDAVFERCAKSFVGAIRDYLKQRGVLPEPLPFHLLEPAATEPFYAMLLLCEAWILSDGRPEFEYSGIKIKAPVAPDDWFRPFEKNTGMDTAKEIAAEMSPVMIRANVESFLTKIAASKKVLREDVLELKQALDLARESL